MSTPGDFVFLETVNPVELPPLALQRLSPKAITAWQTEIVGLVWTRNCTVQCKDASYLREEKIEKSQMDG